MDAIKGALYGFMLVSVAFSGLSVFAEDMGKLGKQVRFVLSLGLIFAILLPFRQVLTVLPALGRQVTVPEEPASGQPVEDLRATLVDLTGELIAEGIRREAEELGGTVRWVKVITDRSDYQNVRLTEIVLCFSREIEGRAAEKICDNISERYRCRCRWEREE